MLPMSCTISLEYCDVYIPQPGKTDVVITIAAVLVENLQLQGDKDHLATCFCFTFGNTIFSIYKIHKGFVIVHDFSGQNSGFCIVIHPSRLKKDKTEPCLAYTACAGILPLYVRTKTRIQEYRNIIVDGQERS